MKIRLWWQYTAAFGEIPVPRDGSLFASYGRWSEDIYTRISKANAVLREIGRSLWSRNGSF